MKSKNTTQVTIGGRIYTLSGFESESYLKKIASYMNQKLAECSEGTAYMKQNPETRNFLLALNIADDYYKANKSSKSYENDMEAKDREIYDLKHDLISAQIKIDNFEAMIDQLKEDNQELKEKIVQLETEIKNMKQK